MSAPDKSEERVAESTAMSRFVQQSGKSVSTITEIVGQRARISWMTPDQEAKILYMEKNMQEVEASSQAVARTLAHQCLSNAIVSDASAAAIIEFKKFVVTKLKVDIENEHETPGEAEGQWRS